MKNMQEFHSIGFYQIQIAVSRSIHSKNSFSRLL